VTEAVAVENVSVPVRGVEFTTWSGPLLENRWSWTTVPGGTERASMVTVTAEGPLIVTSGIVKLPVGVESTGLNPSASVILTTRINGGGMGGKKNASGVEKIAEVVALPVNAIWNAPRRIRPIEPEPPLWLEPTDVAPKVPPSTLRTPVPLTMGARRWIAPPPPPPPAPALPAEGPPPPPEPPVNGVRKLLP
jgi:hypothetical protein